MRRYSLALVAALALVLAGCGGTAFPLLKPVYPEAGNPVSPNEVDSLQPTFRWEPAKEPDMSYDFILYECIKTTDIWKGTSRTMGRELYYREGLTVTEHRIEDPLAPGKEYFWSVRLRKEDKVSRWAVYHYQPDIFLGGVAVRNYPFLFKTPGK